MQQQQQAPAEEVFSVFVGDLAPDVNDFLLMETFRQFYGTVRSAKVRVGGPGIRGERAFSERFAFAPDRRNAAQS